MSSSASSGGGEEEEACLSEERRKGEESCVAEALNAVEGVLEKGRAMGLIDGFDRF